MGKSKVLNEAENIFDDALDTVLALAFFAMVAFLSMDVMGVTWKVLIPALLWMILFSILMKNSRGLTYLLIFGTPVSIYFFGSEWFFWIYWNLFIPSIEFIDSIVTQNSIDTQN